MSYFKLANLTYFVYILYTYALDPDYSEDDAEEWQTPLLAESLS